jgi:hypothetical protein
MNLETELVNWPKHGIGTAAACVCGVWGVLMVQDGEFFGFIPEADLDEAIKKIRKDSAEQADLILRAKRGLPAVKAEVARREERHTNG